MIQAAGGSRLRIGHMAARGSPCSCVYGTFTSPVVRFVDLAAEVQRTAVRIGDRAARDSMLPSGPNEWARRPLAKAGIRKPCGGRFGQPDTQTDLLWSGNGRV